MTRRKATPVARSTYNGDPNGTLPHPPGVCLRCDGIYRGRAGIDQAPRVLTEAEVAALPPEVLR